MNKNSETDEQDFLYRQRNNMASGGEGGGKIHLGI